MYSALRKHKTSIVGKKAIAAFVISLITLSIMDELFNTLGLPKGTFFVLVWLVFVAIFAYSSFQLVKEISFENNYFRLMFYIFMGYGLFTVIRGLSFSTAELTSFLRVPYIFYPFFLPLFAFFGKRLKSLKVLLDYLFYTGFLYIIIILLIPTVLVSPFSSEILAYALVLGPGFLLMNSTYFKQYKVTISFVFVLIATLSFLYLARRAGMFVMFGIIATSYILVIFKKKKSWIFWILPFVLILGVVFLLQYEVLSEGLLKEVNRRLFEDTRTYVTDMFYLDMAEQMTFGKGMNGTYYCPIGGGLTETGLDYNIEYYRDVIENGYLQMILSGGIVHMVLFLFLAVPAAVMGIFNSANQLTRSCGAMIILWLIFMIGSGLPSLSIGYILVWISIGLCYRKSIRSKTDAEIIAAFSVTNNLNKKQANEKKSD